MERNQQKEKRLLTPEKTEEGQLCPVTNKICYSFKEANDRIRAAKRSHKANKPKQIPQRKYWCKYCRWYHLTHFRGLHTAKATLRRYGPKGDKEFGYD